jgi:hypothetical protein
MNAGSERFGGFVRELSEAARNNPVSAALIGMGAVWLFASRTPRGEQFIRRSGIDRIPEAAQSAWEDAASNLRERAQRVQNSASAAAEALRDPAERLRDRVADAGERVTRAAADYADELPHRAGRLADDMRGSVSELFRSRPLALGAVGLAIGAAVAASLPVTETESEYFGESSDRLKEEAGEVIGKEAQRAAERASKAMDAAADEAQRQGLTTDALKEVADDLSQKVARVAEAAVKPPPS